MSIFICVVYQYLKLEMHYFKVGSRTTGSSLGFVKVGGGERIGPPAYLINISEHLGGRQELRGLSVMEDYHQVP